MIHDPALLTLLQQFANPPPAIAQPAEIVDAEPFLSALEAVADEQDRDVEAWLKRVDAMRERTSLAVAAHPHDFPPYMFDDLISRFERYMDWERKAASKRDRIWRRDHVSDRLRALRDRMASRSSKRFEAADDLVLFLRVMRAESTPDSRGGRVFDDADELERYLLNVGR